jgi:hypothetical protein
LNVFKVLKVLCSGSVFAAQVNTMQFSDRNLEHFGSGFDLMLVLVVLEKSHKFRVELRNNFGFHAEI